MDRSQKKCMLASVGGHGLLFVVLVFGSAFINRKADIPELPKLKFIPSILVDQMVAGGGGNPNIPQTDEVPAGGSPTPPVEAAPAPPAPEPPKAVEPPPPAPEAVKPPPEPEPAKPEKIEKVEVPKTPNKITSTKKPKPEPPPKPDAKPVTETTTKPAPKKPQIELDLNKVVTRNSEEAKRKARDAERKAQEEAQRRAEQEAYDNARAAQAKRGAALQSTLSSLGSGFSNDKGVAVPVGGPGGLAYANYGIFVREMYDRAWVVSQSLGDEDRTVEVTVTIQKSGEILSARISKRSGFPALDKSVETAIARVKRVRPFPEGVTEDQRTYVIPFNLKAKRQTG
jgi:protein TonB